MDKNEDEFISDFLNYDDWIKIMKNFSASIDEYKFDFDEIFTKVEFDKDKRAENLENK